MKTPQFMASTDSKAIADFLATHAVGSLVTYQQLNAVIGRDVRKAAASAFRSARKIVQHEHRQVWACVENEGIKRLADDEIVKTADAAREHIRRHARRAARKLTCVNYDQMSKEQQTRHNTALSLFGVMAEVASSKSLARLESRVEQTSEKLPVGIAAVAALGIS